MHRVVERIYSMHFIIDEFISNLSYSRYGVGFARELKKQIEVRFPDKGRGNKLNRLANYLSPQFKGIHLKKILVNLMKKKLYQPLQPLSSETRCKQDNNK